MKILDTISSNDDIEDYIGFYDEKGFWVEDWLDVDDPTDRRKLNGIIPDPVIWHRTPKFSAVICVDGLMLLHISELAKTRPSMSDPDQIAEAVQWWDEHMDYANVMQLYIESESIACPDSGEISFCAVSMEDTCRVGFIGQNPVRKNHTNKLSLMAARCTSFIGTYSTPSHDIGTWSSFTKVKAATIKNALQHFEQAIENPELIKRLALIAKAKFAFSNHDFRGSFTMIWFVVESSLKQLWDLHKTVHNSKKPTVGDMLKNLNSSGTISPDLFALLDDLRDRVRNKLMHQPVTTVCMPLDCHKVADGAMGLLKTIGGVPDLIIKLNYKVEF